MSRTITGGWVAIPRALMKDESEDRLSAHGLLVFAALESFADYETGECYAGHAAIGQRARLSVAAVKRALIELQEYGVVRVERHGANRTNSYWVEYTRSTSDSSGGATGSLPESPPDSSGGATNDLQGNDPQLPIETPTESSPAEPEPPNLDVESGEQRKRPGWIVFEHWQERIPNAKRKSLTNDRKQKIAARLKSFSAEQLCRAIDAVSVDAFSLGVNDRKTPYTDFVTIFKNDSKVDYFLDMADRFDAQGWPQQAQVLTQPAGGKPAKPPTAKQERAARRMAAMGRLTNGGNEGA